MSAFRWLALLVLLAFLSLVMAMAWWTRGERIHQEWTFQQKLGLHSVVTTASRVEHLIDELRRNLHRFTRKHNQEFAAIRSNPDDGPLRLQLSEAVHDTFDDAYAFTLAKPDGTVILDDFEGLIGNQCLADIRAFAAGARVDGLFVHPNEAGPHFDVIAPWRDGGRAEGVFFVSFSVQKIADHLRLGQAPGQKLLLIRRLDSGREYIDLAGDDARKLSPRELTTDDNLDARIVARRFVQGTAWTLVAVRAEDSETEIQAKIDRDAILTVVILTLALAGCFFLIVVAERRLKLAHGRMIQSEKMAALGQMIAGVAHELNTPLAYVRSNMEIVQDINVTIRAFVAEAQRYLKLRRSEPNDSKALAEQEDRLEAAAGLLESNRCPDDANDLLEDGLYGLDQITELVTDLRDFSRADHKKFVPYSVNDAVESALVIAGSLLNDKIRIDNQMDRVPLIYCVPSHIGHVFLNLITNAVQALQDGGVIGLRTEMDERRIKVYVTDDGTGMDRQTMSRIFDPFFTTKTLGKGTGLGLSIAYHIVVEHRGTIEVQSEPGQGTTVVVALPIAMGERRKVNRSRWKRWSADGPGAG